MTKPKKTPRSFSILATAVLGLGAISAASAADAVAAVDRIFVGKVSQGGRYEVEASQLAADKAQAQSVKDFAAKDVEDHTQVNAELKTLASAQGIPLAADLDPKFQKQLDALGGLSGTAFDKAYIASMKAIHKKDEAIFAKEAKAGANADWKAFAAKTDGIVKGHIATLKQIPAKV